MLFRVFAFSIPLSLLPFGAAFAASDAPALDARTLLTLGINLGIIAFAVGTAIACLRAAERARKAEAEAQVEAERYRLSESTLETLLAAEPQALLTVAESGEAELLVATLPPALGVPRDTSELLSFAAWLDASSAQELDDAIDALAERGEPFNLMLRTQRDRYVEIDGRTAGRTIVLKVRDLAGQRLELADLAARHRELEAQVASLRELLEEANKAERSHSETKPSLETRFRSFDRLATAFAVFDAEQRLTHFNHAYVELWQLDPEWLATHPRDGEILDRLRQARRLPEKADYRQWKKGWLGSYGSNAQVEDQWHLPDGRTLHVVADSEGEAGVTYLYENVTEQLALESRYNALIEVQRETLDTLREGVAVFAPNGRLRLYNRAFATIWRLNPRQLDNEPHIEEIITWCRVLYDAPEAWEGIKTTVTAIVAERLAYEKQFDRRDGSVLACAVLPLPDGGTLLTYVDVSDAKHAERALIERAEALEAADRLKTAFISHVSYELRTPLTNIIGFSELLASPIAGPLTEKQRDYLSDIRLSGRTLLAIIDDILDLATIDAGTLELKLSPVKVRDVIGQAVQGVEERLKQNNVELDIAVAPGIDEFVADGRRVTQMLYNLLSNAIGFSEPGGKIALACGCDGAMIAFSVEDQGVGIPADYQQAAFDRFESRSHGSRHRGAGLGLSIVKSLAEIHGGTVSLDSAPGRGTRVTVLLPLKHKPAGEADERVEPRYKSSRAG
ncbi:MAG: PAS-domain containing protein [Methyloceanibacter sp.]|nr:PAS-domain containing protein [Methyloceanibacter sp.]